ncbi:MAG: hypothetical protein EPN60_05665 [Nevskiaceae bacterium]|nr:MAG: hypothetical protein EPO48_03415 [Nevskiaceae bacterium]TAM29890.1 MAG: hypothetical protein EPN60_05665 [Nevskiaceae bacterium]
MRRRNHYDVTNRVEIARPDAVHDAVASLLSALYPGADLGPVQQAFRVFGQLYAGSLRGYAGCDTWYHDAQHSLDCALAFARLLEGHERSAASDERLGARRGLLGVIAALFHDAGYIRHQGDSASNGAEFTFVHVQRSANFLGDFLPKSGYDREAEMARQLVHFTGYELALDAIQVHDSKDRELGFILGTADVLAQTADRCYLEKCRDYLYREFTYCGLAGPEGSSYHSPEELLRGTAEFNRKMWAERLDGYFGGMHRYMGAHFDGRDLYSERIREHLQRVQALAEADALDELRLKPKAIRAAEMREIVAG